MDYVSSHNHQRAALSNAPPFSFADTLQELDLAVANALTNAYAPSTLKTRHTQVRKYLQFCVI